jgi:hypothetical protein
MILDSEIEGTKGTKDHGAFQTDELRKSQAWENRPRRDFLTPRRRR